MKPNNVGEDMWLRGQTANEKLNHGAEKQGVEDMQVKSVL